MAVSPSGNCVDVYANCIAIVYKELSSREERLDLSSGLELKTIFVLRMSSSRY
jgi:hypothetical protein